MLPHHIDIINQSVVQFNIPSCQINIFLQSIASDGPSCEMENRGKHSFKKNHSMQYKYEPISTQFMMSVDFCVSGCVIDWFTTTSNNLSLFYGGKTVRSSLTIVQKKTF